MTKLGRNFYKEKWKQENLVLNRTKILKIEFQNKLINDKFKTVFYCKSKDNPNGRLCVAWERTNFSEGDFIEMKGWMKNDVFIVESHIFTKQNGHRNIQNPKTIQ